MEARFLLETAGSVITYGELLYGAIKRGPMATRREKWRELVDLLPVLPLPVETSEKCGRFGRNQNIGQSNRKP